MVIIDDRSDDQKLTHTMAVVGQDKFLSGSKHLHIYVVNDIHPALSGQ